MSYRAILIFHVESLYLSLLLRCFLKKRWLQAQLWFLPIFSVFFMPFTLPKFVTRSDNRAEFFGLPAEWASDALPTRRDVIRYFALNYNVVKPFSQFFTKDSLRDPSRRCWLTIPAYPYIVRELVSFSQYVKQTCFANVQDNMLLLTNSIRIKKKFSRSSWRASPAYFFLVMI